jgi:hypothetical protein
MKSEPMMYENIHYSPYLVVTNLKKSCAIFHNLSNCLPYKQYFRNIPSSFVKHSFLREIILENYLSQKRLCGA